MTLGVLFKKLYAMPLFILNISISLGILIIAIVVKNWTLTDIFKELRDKVTYFFTAIRSDWILLIVFTLFLISLCYLVLIGYLFPSYAWDALFYHLPTVGFILQSGAIEEIPYNSLIYTFINIFPKNIDLFFLWNVIFLKSDVIVDLSQLLFTVAGMLAIYSMVVKLRIKERYAIYAPFLFFFAPIVILQSTVNYVDIAVSVLFLIALNFILSQDFLCVEKVERGVPLFLAGLTVGILLGSKGSGILFIVALSILFLINEFKRYLYLKPRRHLIKKIIVRYAVYLIVPAILLGSYWYIKNWVYYDNPVYPFRVTLFGKTLFRGMFTEMLNPIPDVIKDLSPLVSPLYVWLEKVEYYFYASDLSGFGPLWFTLFLPSIGFSVFHAIWKKRYDFLSIALVIIFVFFVYPKNWTPRYVIFIFGLGCISFVFMLNYFEKRGGILQFLALLFVIYTFFVSNSPSITPEKIKEFIHLPAKERTLARMEPYILDKTQRGNYGLWAWISNNVSAGDILAYTFTPTLIAPLWNSSFSNKIVYIKTGEFNDWVKRLEADNVTYVLIRLKPRSMEYWWLTRLARLRHIPKWSVVFDKFKVVYSDSEYLVVRFIR
jgi:hypothetical protein